MARRVEDPGRTAIVTGAGGAMGRAIAATLAADGFAVGVLDVVAPPAEETARLIEAAGGKSVALIADITSAEQIVRALDEAEESVGLPAALVNVAGAISLGPFEDISEAEWDRVFDVNLKAVFFLTQEFARRLKAAGRPGSVVNIGSVAAKRVMMNRAHYCSSKAGVQALTKGQALELAEFGIRVNCINPKGIVSGMAGRRISAVDGTIHPQEGWIDDPKQKAIVLQSLPIGLNGQPQDMADAVSYLVSPLADWVTGACIDIDGGYLAGDMFTI